MCSEVFKIHPIGLETPEKQNVLQIHDGKPSLERYQPTQVGHLSVDS